MFIGVVDIVILDAFMDDTRIGVNEGEPGCDFAPVSGTFSQVLSVLMAKNKYLITWLLRTFK